MSAAINLDKKIAGYLELLNTKQKKVVLSVVRAFAEDEPGIDVWQDETFVKELDKRTRELETGKVKGYSWDEVKEITRKSIAEIKRK
jgi:putative addiction module component